MRFENKEIHRITNKLTIEFEFAKVIISDVRMIIKICLLHIIDFKKKILSVKSNFMVEMYLLEHCKLIR